MMDASLNVLNESSVREEIGMRMRRRKKGGR